MKAYWFELHKTHILGKRFIVWESTPDGAARKLAKFLWLSALCGHTMQRKVLITGEWVAECGSGRLRMGFDHAENCVKEYIESQPFLSGLTFDGVLSEPS